MAEPPAKEPRLQGRPSKLTPAIQAKVIELLRAGMSRAGAAGAVRVSASSLKEWIARGEGLDPERPPTPEFEAFAVAVHEAEAKFEQDMLSTIRTATAGRRGDWKAALALLARRFPDLWGKLIRQEHSGPGGGPISIAYDVKTLTDEQLERIARGEPPGPGNPGRGSSGA